MTSVFGLACFNSVLGILSVLGARIQIVCVGLAGDQADQEIMVGFFQTRFTGLSVRDGHKDIGDIDEGAIIFSITGSTFSAIREGTPGIFLA